jgi:outer membrane protein assembly factor BamA
VNYRYTTLGDALRAELLVSDAANFLPCSFENFVWFSDEELERELRARVPLFQGQVPVAGTLLEQIAQALQSALKERGVSGTVQYSARGRLGGPVSGMNFRAAGVKIPVQQVEFLHVQQIDPGLLRELARPLLGKDYDRPFIYDFANNTLTLPYFRRGYLRAAFSEPSARLTGNASSDFLVIVTIPVTEGSQYRLKSVEWSGNNVLPSSELEKHIHLVPGKPVDAVQLNSDFFDIQDLYATKGYLRAAVSAQPLLDDSSLLAAYTLQVREGDLYRMGKLEVSGLDQARAEDVKRAFRLRAGDVFDKSYLDRYLQDVVPHLPRIGGGWKTTTRTDIREAGKTVDVTMTISSAGKP